MADSDYFDIGMVVEVTTRHGKKMQGEVMAFDTNTRVLAISILFFAVKAILTEIVTFEIPVLSVFTNFVKKDCKHFGNQVAL